ncbi:nucleotidyltransferase domain-containing protein [Faecalibaculum rodentium]|uniref:nucleotidyltransferase domain-containing protein n=1 Tax=Faecalibaculum rodentium TaxID=1702221 RepID=UPI0023F571E9|nr:nucleotidyltransferase [Faecalibaculum rodentium]
MKEISDIYCKKRRIEEIDNILSCLVEEIGLTEAMKEKAVRSYKAVGSVLDDSIPFELSIYPQGSLNLGTAIRPYTESDDYDIDLVCKMNGAIDISPKELKKMVGNVLLSHGVYAPKTTEGKRCWKMDYDGYHMDILPASDTDYEKSDYYGKSEIRITHTEDFLKYENRFSNPKGYKAWFLLQTRKNEIGHFSLNEKEIRASVETVPEYNKLSILQKVIQLLKRHRDIAFEGSEDCAPISVIISTLAARAYGGEQSISTALLTILTNMDQFIENREGIYWIANPVDSNENFADKWQLFPERKAAFYWWLEKARTDLAAFLAHRSGLPELFSSMESKFGEKAVKRAATHYSASKRRSRESGNLLLDKNSGEVLAVGEGTGSLGKIPKHTFFGITECD